MSRPPVWDSGPGFYPILDQDYCDASALDPAELVRMWRAADLGYYQWRMKQGSPAEYLRKARILRDRIPELAIIANDHLQAALDNRDLFQGIHLGQEDLRALGDPDRLRLKAAVKDSSLWAGISTHDYAQAAAAVTDDIPWSYIAFGPMTATDSKPGGTDPVPGIDEARRVFELFRDKFVGMGKSPTGRPAPALVLIGGLNPRTLDGVLQPDFLPKYGYLPKIAAIGAASRQDTLTTFLKMLMKYNA